MIELDQMKLELQQYEKPLEEVRDSLDLDFKKQSRLRKSGIRWIWTLRNRGSRSCPESRKHLISGAMRMLPTRR